MTISKCILFASMVLGANFAQAAVSGSNCANAAQSTLTGNRQADVKKAESMTRTNGDAPVERRADKNDTGSAS